MTGDSWLTWLRAVIEEDQRWRETLTMKVNELMKSSSFRNSPSSGPVSSVSHRMVPLAAISDNVRLADALKQLQEPPSPVEVFQGSPRLKFALEGMWSDYGDVGRLWTDRVFDLASPDFWTPDASARLGTATHQVAPRAFPVTFHVVNYPAVTWLGDAHNGVLGLGEVRFPQDLVEGLVDACVSVQQIAGKG